MQGAICFFCKVETILLIYRLMDMKCLPSPQELRQRLPASHSQQAFIAQSRRAIQEIIQGKSSKRLLIAGPCSVHNITEALEYAKKLHHLSLQLKDHFFIVMRTYFEKPRTSIGWKGLLYDPYLDGSHAIEKGLEMSRHLLLELAAMELPAGTEFLDPAVPAYLEDLISWGCIGARTAASQIHRQMASDISLPMGFKNSVYGDYDVAIHGVYSASKPHTFFGINAEGRIAQKTSTGNPYCHVVLRGSEEGPNFDPITIQHVSDKLKNLSLTSRLLIDCSHGNSYRNWAQQEPVFQKIVNQLISQDLPVAGFLLESYLFSGNQEMPQSSFPLRYGISLTDPCLDWESTADLLHKAHAELSKSHNALSGV